MGFQKRKTCNDGKLITAAKGEGLGREMTKWVNGFF